jgi:Ca2+-binding RTX toxin-like protein
VGLLIDQGGNAMATFNFREFYNKIYTLNVAPAGLMTSGLSTLDVNNNPASNQYLAAGAHTITLASGDRLITEDGLALNLLDPVVENGYALTAKFSFTLNINGVISATTSTGLQIENGKSTSPNKITVGKDGAVGGVGSTIYATALTNIDNSGVISSDDYGMAITIQGNTFNSNIKPTTLTTINNSVGAIIAGGTHGIFYGGAGKLAVNNKGTLVAVDAVGNSGQTIESIEGSVVVTNDVAATISGSVRVGWLNSVVTNKGTIDGTIKSNLYGQYDLSSLPSPYYGYVDYNRNGSGANEPGDKHLNFITETAFTITNSGEIDGIDDWRYVNGNPVEVALDLSDGKDIITNTGRIEGAIYARAGNDTLDNGATGKIDGNIEIGTNLYYANIGAFALDADTITNKGLIEGSISTRIGKDVLTNSGEITGSIELGTNIYEAANKPNTDYDTLTNTNLIRGSVWTGLGDDVVTNSGTIGKGVDMGGLPGDIYNNSGVWTWNNDTTSPNKDFDNDKDKLTNTGVISLSVFTGHGADTVTNSGLINGDLRVGTLTALGSAASGIPYTAVDLGTFQADDKDTVTNSGTIAGAISTGLGADVITNSGSTFGIYTTETISIEILDGFVEIPIILPDGANTFDTDTVTNSGIVRDAISTGVGVDKIYNKATGKITAGGIDSGDDADIIENDGYIAGDVRAGNSADKITNRGTVAGNVFLGIDNATNVLINTKVISGSISGNSVATVAEPAIVAQGNNTIENSGVISGSVLLGSGSDSVKNLGSGRIEGLVLLGDGVDSYTGNASNELIVEAAGGDKYIMGAGDDIFFVNTIDIDQDLFDGGTGNDTMSFNEVAADVGLVVNLSNIAAQIIGYVGTPGAQLDKASNIENIVGGNGNDTLVGSALKNLLSGGEGNDLITGGGGQDLLAGGGGADQFIYTLITDSIAGAFDVIGGFEIGVDTINLSAITTGTIFAQEDFTTTMSSGNAQWRTSQVGGKTILEINIDADLAADMTIYFGDILSLSETDFIF